MSIPWTTAHYFLKVLSILNERRQRFLEKLHDPKGASGSGLKTWPWQCDVINHHQYKLLQSLTAPGFKSAAHLPKFEAFADDLLLSLHKANSYRFGTHYDVWLRTLHDNWARARRSPIGDKLEVREYSLPDVQRYYLSRITLDYIRHYGERHRPRSARSKAANVFNDRLAALKVHSKWGLITKEEIASFQKRVWGGVSTFSWWQQGRMRAFNDKLTALMAMTYVKLEKDKWPEGSDLEIVIPAAERWSPQIEFLCLPSAWRGSTYKQSAVRGPRPSIEDVGLARLLARLEGEAAEDDDPAAAAVPPAAAAGDGVGPAVAVASSGVGDDGPGDVIDLDGGPAESRRVSDADVRFWLDSYLEQIALGGPTIAMLGSPSVGRYYQVVANQLARFFDVALITSKEAERRVAPQIGISVPGVSAWVADFLFERAQTALTSGIPLSIPGPFNSLWSIYQVERQARRSARVEANLGPVLGYEKFFSQLLAYGAAYFHAAALSKMTQEEAAIIALLHVRATLITLESKHMAELYGAECGYSLHQYALFILRHARVALAKKDVDLWLRPSSIAFEQLEDYQQRQKCKASVKGLAVSGQWFRLLGTGLTKVISQHLFDTSEQSVLLSPAETLRECLLIGMGWLVSPRGPTGDLGELRDLLLSQVIEDTSLRRIKADKVSDLIIGSNPREIFSDAQTEISEKKKGTVQKGYEVGVYLLVLRLVNRFILEYEHPINRLSPSSIALLSVVMLRRLALNFKRQVAVDHRALGELQQRINAGDLLYQLMVGGVVPGIDDVVLERNYLLPEELRLSRHYPETGYWRVGDILRRSGIMLMTNRAVYYCSAVDKGWIVSPYGYRAYSGASFAVGVKQVKALGYACSYMVRFGWGVGPSWVGARIEAADDYSRAGSRLYCSSQFMFGDAWESSDEVKGMEEEGLIEEGVVDPKAILAKSRRYEEKAGRGLRLTQLSALMRLRKGVSIYAPVHGSWFRSFRFRGEVLYRYKALTEAGIRDALGYRRGLTLMDLEAARGRRATRLTDDVVAMPVGPTVTPPGMGPTS